MYEDIFNNKIEGIKKAGQYRIFIPIDRVQGKYPLARCEQAKNKEAIVWCSNDYLGMSQNPSVVRLAHDTIDKFGMGAGGSRNIGGTSSITCELEKTIAAGLKPDGYPEIRRADGLYKIKSILKLAINFRQNKQKSNVEFCDLKQSIKLYSLINQLYALARNGPIAKYHVLARRIVTNSGNSETLG